jgi:hypothetical protein
LYVRCVSRDRWTDVGAEADEARALAFRLLAAASSREPGSHTEESSAYARQLGDAARWAASDQSRLVILLDSLTLLGWVGVYGLAELQEVDVGEVLARMQRAVDDQLGDPPVGS